VGRGQRRARPTTEKTAHDDFFHFKSFFQLNESAKENKIGEILGTSGKCEILYGDIFEYFPQLSYWEL
jgi:hypothetical protein